MKIAVVTDSTAYLTDEQCEMYSIYRLPLSVIMEKEIIEETKIDPTTFFEKVKTMETLPTSSQPPIGEASVLFNELFRTYDAVISIHLSSELSGTYNTIKSLAAIYEDFKIYPYDSGISCSAQGYFVLEAARMAKEGFTVEEIFHTFEKIQKTLQAYFVVDDLNHLVRGGRLSNGSAMIGSLLKIKPILHFEDKKITVFEKIRTKKKALKRIEQLLGEDVAKGYPIVTTIIHANAEQEALAWMEDLKQQYPTLRYEISYFGPVIGTHLGEGALGMTWAEDQTRK
ncbi:MAG: DegV family protein [Carnobacterium sp.]|uniref:DegV family protein n=1 Tax=Carnobacterium sp. TaxID=48221 RepID=UPI0033150DC8